MKGKPREPDLSSWARDHFVQSYRAFSHVLLGSYRGQHTHSPAIAVRYHNCTCCEHSKRDRFQSCRHEILHAGRNLAGADIYTEE